jgi:hypothetical protein
MIKRRKAAQLTISVMVKENEESKNNSNISIFKLKFAPMKSYFR